MREARVFTSVWDDSGRTITILQRMPDWYGPRARTAESGGPVHHRNLRSTTLVWLELPELLRID